MTDLIIVTPMDFLRISTETKSGTSAAESSEPAAAIPFTASIETITVHSKQTESIGTLRQLALEPEERMFKRLESITAEQ